MEYSQIKILYPDRIFRQKRIREAWKKLTTGKCFILPDGSRGGIFVDFTSC